ncbi:LCP family protein [Candidatus Gracilibacteria bacterium]|nr:LCP family protein [Candidatus Gracilibacteria bacterium]
MYKHIKELRRLVIIILVILFGATVSFSMIIRDNQKNLFSKELKISSLIDEVGELKQQNMELIETMEKRNSSLSSISNQLSEFGKDLKIMATDKKNISQAGQELSSIQKDLTKALTVQDRKISRLSAQNNNLKEELALNDKIAALDTRNYLIVGENKKLTDTIIIAAVDEANNKVTLISLPRDFYYNGRKINELYFRYGIEKLADAIKDVTGLEIDNYVIFDFEAFTKLIDEVGGLDLDVSKKLVDNAYPGPNNTYIKVSFQAGKQHMDGSTALKYARSRESTSDFDRSRRQQQIIQGLSEKFNVMGLAARLDIASKLYNLMAQYVSTDIGFFDAIGAYGKYKDYPLRGGNVISTANVLQSSQNEKGQYILTTKDKSYIAIKNFVAEALTK